MLNAIVVIFSILKELIKPEIRRRFHLRRKLHTSNIKKLQDQSLIGIYSYISSRNDINMDEILYGNTSQKSSLNTEARIIRLNSILKRYNLVRIASLESKFARYALAAILKSKKKNPNNQKYKKKQYLISTLFKSWSFPSGTAYPPVVYFS